VSPLNTDRANSGMTAIGVRAKGAAAQAVPLGKRAGTTAVQRARQGVAGASQWAAPRVQNAVRGARQWAAPRIEGAADAVTNSVAPRVSSALRSTARQVDPQAPSRNDTRKLLDWRWLVGLGAALATAGASAALAIRRRYAKATAAAEDTEQDAVDGSADGESPADPAGSEVNGRVTTPGS
jgi:hypothetical protein